MDALDDLPPRPSSVPPPNMKWPEAEAKLDRLCQENFVYKLTYKLKALRDDPSVPKLPKWIDPFRLYIRGHREFMLPTPVHSSCPSTPFSDEEDWTPPQQQSPSTDTVSPTVAHEECITKTQQLKRKRHSDDSQQSQVWSPDARLLKRMKPSHDSQQQGIEHSYDDNKLQHSEPQQQKREHDCDDDKLQHPEHQRQKRKRDDGIEQLLQDLSPASRLYKKMKPSPEPLQQKGAFTCNNIEVQHLEPPQRSRSCSPDSDTQSEETGIGSLTPNPQSLQQEGAFTCNDGELQNLEPQQRNRNCSPNSDTLSEETLISSLLRNGASSFSSRSSLPSLPDEQEAFTKLHDHEPHQNKRNRSDASDEDWQSGSPDAMPPENKTSISHAAQMERETSDDHLESFGDQFQPDGFAGSDPWWPDCEQRYDDMGEPLRQEQPLIQEPETSTPQEPQTLPLKKFSQYQNFQESDCRHFHTVDTSCWWVANVNYNWKNILET